jgi:uncharacterized RDD family membrane protein YckC
VFCSRCGFALADDARFCANCGATVVREPAPAETPAGKPAQPRFDPYDPTGGATRTGPVVRDGRPPFLQEMPASIRLSSAWRRLGGNLLDGLLILVTLLIGWIVWSIVLWDRGQTPAKQLLGMRVLHRNTLTSARRGRMFLREVPCKWIIYIFANFTLIGIVAYFWLLWDSSRQELWDKMVETIVVNDPENLLDPRTAQATPTGSL